jgi:hypothetical protein
LHFVGTSYVTYYDLSEFQVQGNKLNSRDKNRGNSSPSGAAAKKANGKIQSTTTCQVTPGTIVKQVFQMENSD